MLKERLGLFDDPYRRCQSPESGPVLMQRRSLARDAAVQSLVLMSNRNDILPLRSRGSGESP